MEVQIKYGHSGETLSFSDEERVHVAVPTAGPPPAGDETELILEALANPVDSPKLRELAQGKSKVVILISDHTRPTPSGLIVPLLLKELAAGGVGEDQVTVMIACGLHDRTKPEMVEKILGPELFSRIKTVVHDPDDEDNLVELGQTDLGTPLAVNRLVVEADLVVSVSTIEPHLFYGWSGGAKNILPGVAARKTVNFHHGRFYKVFTGLDKTDDNIHREDAENAARLAGLDFICNVVLNPQRKIMGAFAGEMVAAHRAGVQLGRQLNVTTVPERADILISGLGGSPRDADFWQVEGKALMHTQHLTKDDGVMILAAGCEKGIGGKLFQDLLLKTPEEIKRFVAVNDYSVPSMKANDLVRASERFKVWLVCPGIKPADLPSIPVRFFGSIHEAYEEARKIVESCPPATIVVPDASRVVINVDDTIHECEE